MTPTPRRTQYMTPAGKPLFIETPAGMITIEWDRSNVRRKKLAITMPGCFTVHRTEDRATKDMKFLRKENGHLVPDYLMLVPVVDDRGEIAGVERPGTLTLAQA